LIRALLALLRRWDAPEDLLAPPLRAEFYVYVRPDGTSQMYASKLQATPEEIGALTKVLIDNALTYAQKHGVFIEGAISNKR
jgi:hypothetical protein